MWMAGSQCLEASLLPLGVCVDKNVVSGVRPGDWVQVLHCGTQALRNLAVMVAF